MKSDLFKKEMELTEKAENSFKYEDGKITVYLADRRIVDEEGNVIGYFDTEHSLNYNRVVHFEEEEYFSANDFENLRDFEDTVEKMKRYFKFKEEEKGET